MERTDSNLAWASAKLRCFAHLEYGCKPVNAEQWDAVRDAFLRLITHTPARVFRDNPPHVDGTRDVEYYPEITERQSGDRLVQAIIDNRATFPSVPDMVALYRVGEWQTEGVKIVREKVDEG